MNIVISLDCSAETLEGLLQDIKASLQSRGYAPEQQLEMSALHVLKCAMLAAPIETPDEPAPEDIPAGVDVEQELAAVMAMDPSEVLPEPTESEQVNEIPPVVDYGQVKVLTLSTNHPIPSMRVPELNTSLQTTGRILNDGIVRFTYNGFEHALPVADAGDVSVVNPTHNCGPSTVRLVIDIANKTYACLVDIEGGETELLQVGDDLANVVEVAAHVSAE